MTITDRTIHKLAWDICDKVLTLEVIKFTNMPEPLKFQAMNQMVTVLQYIVLLIESQDLLSRVEQVLLEKAPDVITPWRDVRRVILRDEAEHQKREMQFDVNDTSQAESILNAIRKRT
jgi:hypothetical protein